MTILFSIIIAVCLVSFVSGYEPMDIIDNTVEYMEDHMKVGFLGDSVTEVNYELVKVRAIEDTDDIIVFYDIRALSDMSLGRRVGFVVNPDENNIKYILVGSIK